MHLWFSSLWQPRSKSGVSAAQLAALSPLRKQTRSVGESPGQCDHLCDCSHRNISDYHQLVYIGLRKLGHSGWWLRKLGNNVVCGRVRKATFQLVPWLAKLHLVLDTSALMVTWASLGGGRGTNFLLLHHICVSPCYDFHDTCRPSLHVTHYDGTKKNFHLC